jgi:hypothetical protein
MMEDYIDVLPVGIGELENALIQVYPNPNQGSFKLNNISGQELNISINSLLGQQVYESRITSGVHTISIDSLPSGLYLIRVVDNTGKVMNTQKVMIY